jgi:hypothetical protein
MRICDKCGWENEDPQRNDDLWCTQCRTFLGFPVEGPRLHERRIVMQLVEAEASVAPGGEARVGAWVRNSGDVVEKVTFSVEGAPAAWTQVEPSEVGLFPRQKGEVQVVFRPPRSWQVRSGLTPFRVIATSESDETAVDHAEGTVDVGAFVDVKASLHPLQSAGPMGGEHRLSLENAGNAIITAAVRASQPGDDLSFRMSSDSVALEPGASGEVDVSVVPRQALFAAADKRHAFTVGVLAPGQAPIGIQAVHIQEAPATAPTLVLSDTRLHAAPGQEVAAALKVRNRGRGGEDYALEIVGPAADWGRVVPPVIALPTAGEVEAKVVFLPPLVPPAPASEVPYAVRCRGQVDPRPSAVAEGRLTVDPVSDISFDVQPARVRGRWSSRHVIEVENRGNATAELRPVLVNPQHELAFAVSPPMVRMPASSRELVLFKARTRRPKLLGKPATRSFEVFLAPAEAGARTASRGEEVRRQISFEQIAVLPRKLTALVVVAAVIGALAATALVFFTKQVHHLF